MMGFAVFLSLMATGPRLEGANVNVFAAVSLAESLKEIAAVHEKESGDRIVFNFASSSLLARQIVEGAPADLFFSADEASMNLLEIKGLIEKGSRKNRLSNSLVIVTTREDGAMISGPADLAGPAVKRVALGNPRAVPVGVYARQYLEGLKLWSAVQPKVVAADNGRAALAAVESGNVDAGIVYKTDAALSSKVKVVFEISQSQGPAIHYPMALIQEGKHPEAARKFMDRLQSKAAGRVFARFGYLVPDTGDAP